MIRALACGAVALALVGCDTTAGSDDGGSVEGGIAPACDEENGESLDYQAVLHDTTLTVFVTMRNFDRSAWKAASVTDVAGAKLILVTPAQPGTGDASVGDGVGDGPDVAITFQLPTDGDAGASRSQTFSFVLHGTILEGAQLCDITHPVGVTILYLSNGEHSINVNI